MNVVFVNSSRENTLNLKKKKNHSFIPYFRHYNPLLITNPLLNNFQVSLTRKNMNVKLPHYKVYNNNSQHKAGVLMVVLKVKNKQSSKACEIKASYRLIIFRNFDMILSKAAIF